MAFEVDPMEAVIKLARADTALNAAVGGRIDDRHHYGQDAGDWALDAASLILFPAAGVQPRLDAFAQRMQLEARCYGDSFYLAGAVYKKLVDWTRVNARRTVTVTEGKALVYYVVVRGQPRQILDEEARPNGGMPAYQVILEALVAESTVV